MGLPGTDMNHGQKFKKTKFKNYFVLGWPKNYYLNVKRSIIHLDNLSRFNQR